MEFRHLRTFEAVASFMSFNRAAEALHCTQSTVSAQIKLLEEDLGQPVFERLGRRIALTSAGEELRRHVRRLLSYEEEIHSSLAQSGQTRGLITLRVPQSVADAHLPAILKRFNAAHPRVGFDVSNCGYLHLADELRSGEIDAAFLLASAVESTELHTVRLLTEPMAYVAGPACDLARRSRLTLSALSGRTLLLPKHDCGYRMQLEQGLREEQVELASLIELNSLSSLVQCLKEGLGVALLPERAVAQKLSSGALCKLDWAEPLSADLFLMCHRDKPREGAFGAFLEVVEGYFAERRRAETKRPSGNAAARKKTRYERRVR